MVQNRATRFLTGNYVYETRRMTGIRGQFKIQETLFNVDFQMYNIITLAMGYFVDKYDMKKLYMYKHFNKITDLEDCITDMKT